MKLGVVVALWKRPRLTALCLRQIARHAPEGTILAPFHPDDVAAFRALQATLRAERARKEARG